MSGEVLSTRSSATVATEGSCSSVFVEARQYPGEPEISCTDSTGSILTGRESFSKYPGKANYEKLTLCAAENVTCILVKTSDRIEGSPTMTNVMNPEIEASCACSGGTTNISLSARSSKSSHP